MEACGPKVFYLQFLGFFFFHIQDTAHYDTVDCGNQFTLGGDENFASWTKITVEEFQTYVGFILLMGLVKLPSISNYWKKDELYNYRLLPGLLVIVSLSCTHYLHFVDNSTSGTQECKKLSKVQPIIDVFTTISGSIQCQGRMYTGKQGDTGWELDRVTESYINSFSRVYFDKLLHQSWQPWSRQSLWMWYNIHQQERLSWHLETCGEPVVKQGLKRGVRIRR